MIEPLPGGRGPPPARDEKGGTGHEEDRSNQSAHRDVGSRERCSGSSARRNHDLAPNLAASRIGQLGPREGRDDLRGEPTTVPTNTKPSLFIAA